MYGFFDPTRPTQLASDRSVSYDRETNPCLRGMAMLYRGVIIALFPVLALSLNLAVQDKQGPPKLELTAAEKTILDLTNKARADEKLPPLVPNLKLSQAARQHSTNMAKQEKMEHELDGKKPVDRVKAVGYA